MTIDTPRCRVRPFLPSDLEALSSLLSSPEAMAHLGPVRTREESQRFLRNAGLGDSPLIYAIQGRMIPQLLGYLIFHPLGDGCWELGWVLFPRFWGIGIARELTRAVITWGREQNIRSLLLQCSPKQTATIEIARHFGFKPQQSRDGRLIFCLAL